MSSKSNVVSKQISASKETRIKDFPDILKRMLQNIKKVIKTYLLCLSLFQISRHIWPLTCDASQQLDSEAEKNSVVAFMGWKWLTTCNNTCKNSNKNVVSLMPSAVQWTSINISNAYSALLRADEVGLTLRVIITL